MNSYLKSIKSGFTLVELLLASMLTLVVVTITGMAVAQMTQSNVKANLESQMQYNLNRSVEFVSNEIRNAQTIETNPATYAASVPSGATPILVLQIPTSVNPSGKPIIYYTMATNKSTYPWLLGNLALYRWGPAIGSDGNYDKTAAWEHAPIIDMLSDKAKPTTESCATGEKEVSAKIPGTTADAEGFYVCLVGDRLAKLHAISNIYSDRLSDTVTKRVDTQAFARSALTSFGGKILPDGSTQLIIIKGGDVTGKIIVPDTTTTPINMMVTDILSRPLSPTSPNSTLSGLSAGTKIFVNVGAGGGAISSETPYGRLAFNGTSVNSLNLPATLNWDVAPLNNFTTVDANGRKYVKLPPNQVMVIVLYGSSPVVAVLGLY